MHAESIQSSSQSSQTLSDQDLSVATQALSEALLDIGEAFLPSTWQLVCASHSNPKDALLAYIQETGLQFHQLFNVSAQEYRLVSSHALCGSPDQPLFLKKQVDQINKPLDWVIELKKDNSTSKSSKYLSLSEFWLAIRKATWLTSAMKAGLPNMRPVVFTSFLINLLALAPAMFSIQVYDRIIPNQAFSSLWALAFGVALCLGFELILKKSRHHLMEHAATTTDTLCTKKLADKLVHASIQTSRPALLLQHLRSFENLRDVITGVFLLALVDLPFLFLFLGFLAIIQPYLLLVALITLSLTLVNLVRTHRKLSALGQEQLELNQSNQSLWLETLANLPALQSLGIQGLWSRQLSTQQLDQRLNSNVIREVVFSSNQATHLLQQAGWIATLATGTWLIVQNELSIGGMIAASMLTMRCFSPILKLQTQVLSSHIAQSGFLSLDRFMTQSTEYREGRQNLPGIQTVSMTGVSVAYREKKPSLVADSFTLRAGDRVGVIGPTGSGKSTLLRTLAGLLQPAEGAVCINDFDLRQFNPSEYSRHMGLSEQPPQLFEGTLIDNIKMGRPWISYQDCLQAISHLGLDSWVAKQPSGLDMKIDPEGRNLSAGQRQMISLARAFAGQPALLILDEPSVCLDQASEQCVLEAIEKLPRSSIVVMATHKLGLLKNTPLLMYIEGGQMKAFGDRASVARQAKSNGEEK